MSDQQIAEWKPPGGDVEAYTAPTAGTTPAQSRVEAVSSLLAAAYQRASTLEMTPEEDAALSQDFPDDAFKPGASGKEHLIYIEHAFLRDRFNAVFGRGKWAMVRTRPHWAEEYRTAKGTQATRIYAEAALLVRGCYVGESIGDMSYYPNNDSQNYGDAAEGAMTAAFRRCAKNFGVGLQAWKKDFGAGWQQRQRTGAPAPAPRQAQAPAPAAQPQPAQAPAPQARPAAPAAQVTGGATAKTREWMLAKLDTSFSALDVQMYAVEMKIIPAGGVLSSDWPLSAVPATGPALRELIGKVQAWIVAQKPADDPDAPPVEDAQGEPATDDIDAQPWSTVVITVPPAGKKKVDYMTSPDSISSLYHKMKAGDETSRTRLWGMAKMWTPQPWVGQDGATRQPSQMDIAARAALDQFIAWHDDKEGK